MNSNHKSDRLDHFMFFDVLNIVLSSLVLIFLFIVQELFKVSTTAGTRRKKSTSNVETNSPNNQSSKESTFTQKPELRRTSSFDRTWEETVAESVANELVSQMQGQSNVQSESQDAAKDSKLLRPVRSTREDKKIVEPNEVKQTRPQKLMDFRNIKISQVGINFFINYKYHVLFV